MDARVTRGQSRAAGEAAKGFSGVPLNQAMEQLATQGLVVEGAHANGVSEVLVSRPGENPSVLKVKPIVVYSGPGLTDAQTVYFPRRQ